MLKQMTIQDMINKLEEHKKVLGANEPVWFFSGLFVGLNGYHEHAPFEVEGIEYRKYEENQSKRLIIK